MRILIFILLLFCCHYANSQYYFLDKNYLEKPFMFKAGAGTGMMNCLTDLGGGKNKSSLQTINWKNSRPSVSFFVSTTFKNAVSLRLDLNFGNVNASDSSLKKIKEHTRGRYERNLSFKSHINEIQLLTEIYPGAFFKMEKHHSLNPYMLGGIGYFSFNPKARLDGVWYQLQPLHTEGQGFREYPLRKNYRLSQFNWSLGGGLNYEFSALVHGGMEINYRFLHTDYLDDVSTGYIDPLLFEKYLPVQQATAARQLYKRTRTLNPDQLIDDQRGNPLKKDAYFSITTRIIIIIGQMRH